MWHGAAVFFKVLLFFSDFSVFWLEYLIVVSLLLYAAGHLGFRSHCLQDSGGKAGWLVGRGEIWIPLLHQSEVNFQSRDYFVLAIDFPHERLKHIILYILIVKGLV